ncbi:MULTISPECIES: phytoene/squalene synthase family protein [Luteimonas]|uniref:phytoene/squalene synthase family protein n=1 Tax=Luteimonas TaxID=83614 RepID=UPI000C7C2B09|nr:MULTISPECIES: phytoene/squalene synthase family protein [Luteimonas]
MNATSDGDTDFLAKWQARWPEWRIAAAFVPEAQRTRLQAWFGLLDELTDAAWAGADPTPGLAKLAWWQEELQGWAKQARRHPLAVPLYRSDAPWQTLALALRNLPAMREDPDAAGAHLASLQDLARAVAACERHLFDENGQASAAVHPHAAPLLASQAFLTGSRILAEALLAAWPARGSGTRPRRLHDTILHGRLQILARSGQVDAVSAPAMLVRSWRAARAG